MAAVASMAAAAVVEMPAAVAAAALTVVVAEDVTKTYGQKKGLRTTSSALSSFPKQTRLGSRV